MAKAQHWKALFGAIILEVYGATVKKLPQDGGFYGGPDLVIMRLTILTA